MALTRHIGAFLLRRVHGFFYTGIREELRRIMRDAGLDGEVELYVYRPAFEVDEKKGAPLRQAIARAHGAVVGGELKLGPATSSSMWRDLNCFNEMRIPSYTYGPGASVGGGIFRMPIQNMVAGAQLCVHTALDLCNQERP
jgi:hypothetical protein